MTDGPAKPYLIELRMHAGPAPSPAEYAVPLLGGDWPGISRPVRTDDDPHWPSQLRRWLRDRLAVAQDPLLVLSGRLQEQLKALRVIAALPGDVRPRVVLCLTRADRPLLPEVSVDRPGLHGLLLDAAPSRLEQQAWRRHLGEDFDRRWFLIEPPLPTPVADTGTDGSEPVVLLPARRNDRWLALAMQAFQTWSQARYARCCVCNYLVAAATPGAALPADACPWCGGGLQSARPRSARLRVYCLDGGDSGGDAGADPRALAEWLGIAGQSRFSAPTIHAGGFGLVAGDIVLLLGDPAFDEPWLSRLAANAGVLVTNLPVEPGDAAAILRVENSQCGWDHRGQVQCMPALGEIVRALDEAADRDPHGPGASHVRPAYPTDWRAALQALAALPAPPGASGARFGQQPGRA